MPLTFLKQPRNWTQWRLVRSNETTVALLERDDLANRWVARKLVGLWPGEPMEIDSILNRFNKGLLLLVAGEPPFCTRCVRLLESASKSPGSGLQCHQCGTTLCETFLLG